MKRLHLYVVLDIIRTDSDPATLSYQPAHAPEKGLITVREEKLADGERLVASDGPVSWSLRVGYLGAWPAAEDGTGARLTDDQILLVDTIMAGLDAKADFTKRLHSALESIREHVDRYPPTVLDDDLKHEIIHKIDTLEASSR